MALALLLTLRRFAGGAHGTVALHTPMAGSEISLVQLGVAALLLLGLACAGGARLRVRQIIGSLALATVALQGWALFSIVRSGVRQPREWDFLCFWLWGRLGASGSDFYTPGAASAFTSGLRLSETFERDILAVGFWYPPPSMLLMAPLGLTSPELALAGWYLLQAGALLASAWLLQRCFLRELGRTGLFLTLALVLTWPSVRTTFWYAQSHPLVLCLALLALRDLGNARAGVWSALAVIVKPYTLLWFGALALLRNGRALKLGALVLLGLCVLTATLFGPREFVTYLLDNPLRRTDIAVHSDPVNQSLFATALRLTHMESYARHPLVEAQFVVLALSFLGMTGVVVKKLARSAPEVGFTLALTAVLIVYPSTLSHYSILLLIPLFALWSRRALFPGGPVAVAALGLVQFALVKVEPLAFWATASAWLALVALAYRMLGEHGRANRRGWLVQTAG